MDSGQFAWLRHQQLQKRFEQAFTPDPDVVHELKEAQVERRRIMEIIAHDYSCRCTGKE